MGSRSDEWDYEQFKKGCIALQADSIDSWRSNISNLGRRINKDAAYFKKVYMQAFICSKEKPDNKYIDVESAFALWTMFMNDKC